ncbi:MAG: hypothetical protein J6C28_00530 [Bacilli bacterium]|nr:hypothetical protein [Bacilli bacterium]
MNLKYEDIKTPEELLEWMQNITYGYLGKEKPHTYQEPDFNEVWYDEYLLSKPEEVIENKIGNCWDQTELERKWFRDHNYKVKTIYVMVNLPYENIYPTHSYLIYQDKDNSWKWFENSDFNNRGIHTKNNEQEIINYQLTKYKEFLKTFNITKEELEKIIIKVYEEPKYHITAEEYINHVINSKDYKGE